MDKFEKQNSNQINEMAEAWQVAPEQEKTPEQIRQELEAQYDEVAGTFFQGQPEDYEDPSQYLEMRYIFEERKAYEMRKLEEKLYEFYRK